VNRAWAPRSARLRSHHHRVRATTNTGTRTPSAGRNLRPRDRSRQPRAHFDVCPRSPRTLSPATSRAPVVNVEPPRRADPAPALSALRPASPRWGRCVQKPASATDLHDEYPLDRSILESPSPPTLAGEAGFHGAPPGRNLGGGHDRVEPRLTANLQLRQRSQMASRVPPRGVQHRSFLMSPWPRSLRRRSLYTPALSAGDEGPDRASDALCRANLPRGVSPASSWYQG
jgi:hypothetical protein